MTATTLLRLLIVLCGLTLAHAGGAAAATGRSSLDEAMSHDGLQRVQVKGIELAYALPGATLAGYARIRLDPVEVAFRKDWNPQRTGSHLKVTSAERERIRTDVARLVAEEFVRELQKTGTYKVVNESGPDVLRVKVSIVNLYINAPDTLAAGRSTTYTASAGEMTLFAELFDAESGQAIARIVDRKEARRSGLWTATDGVTNANEGRDIASRWARILRDGLDRSRGIGAAQPAR